jgi:hypothetical protein
MEPLYESFVACLEEGKAHLADAEGLMLRVPSRWINDNGLLSVAESGNLSAFSSKDEVRSYSAP